MAVKDVKFYYKTIQNQFHELLENAKDFDEAIKAGLVEEWQYKQAQDMANRLKENLDRWTAMIVMLNEPARKEKKLKYKKQNKKLYEALVGNTPEDVIKEDEDILKEFREFVKGIKEKK